VGGKYIGAKAKNECSAKEIQFCRELFAAMYEDAAGTTDPIKLVYPYTAEQVFLSSEKWASHYN